MAPLLDRLHRADAALAVDVLDTVAELVPYAPGADGLADHDLLHARLRHNDGNQLAWSRLTTRRGFDTTADIATLTAIAAGLRAWHVELAVELLGQRGAAALCALPTLHALLDLPDPRIVGSSARVPLRRKAARAILAIAPDGKQAAHARAVIAGDPEPAANAAAMPLRLRQRIDQLLQELEHDPTRTAATANLVALGANTARPLVEALAHEHTAAFRDAALMALRQLGRAAAPVAVDLRVLLPRLPIEHTVAVYDALTATAPWSRDVADTNTLVMSTSTLRIDGQTVPGNTDGETMTQVDRAAGRFWSAMSMDPTWPLAKLVGLLEDRDVRLRKRALELLGQRHDTARAVLPQIAAAMRAEHPQVASIFWQDDGSMRTGRESSTLEVQALAAEAILAIAAPDDRLVAEARRVLPQAEKRR